MSKDDFHDALRISLHRSPFVPFDVILRDGRHLLFREPLLVFDDGAASFIDPVDGALVEFVHDQVVDIDSLRQDA